MIERDAREFLRHLLEANSTRVQSDILNRLQESRSQLETEIRKLPHEISRIAEQASTRARAAQAAGVPAVQAALARLDGLEHRIVELRASSGWRPVSGGKVRSARRPPAKPQGDGVRLLEPPIDVG